MSAFSSHSKSSIEDFSDEDRFRELALEAQRAAARDGFTLTPFRSPELPVFTALDREARRAACAKLERLVNVAAGVHASGHTLRDCRKVIWSFFKVVKLTPPSDLIDRLDDIDFVDVYGFDHQMIFANLPLLNAVSYTLEELYCRHWMELFGRSDGLLGTIRDTVVGITTGSIQNVVDLRHLPEHTAYEISSDARLSGRGHVRFFSPLFQSGATQAYLCVNRPLQI